MEAQQKLANSKEVLSFLATTYPKCFSLGNDAKPLKIGIFHDLAERLDGNEIVSKRLLRMALRHYTSSWKYLASIQIGAHRVDLDGNDGDIIEQEHADHAALQLQESKAKAAEKRQALKQEQNDKRKQRAKVPSSSKDTPNKGAAKKEPRRKPAATPKVKVRELNDQDLKVGLEVSVKVGKTPMPATITDLAKDGIQVQLNSGMSVKVQREQLRLAV